MTIHSVEAEQSILGSVIADGSIFQMVDVKANDFYIQRHGMIWNGFADLYAAGRAIDFVTITERLQEKGQLEEIGGAGYLTGLIAISPNVTNASDYAEVVKEKAVRRNLLDIAGRLATASQDQKQDMQQIVPSFVNELTNASMIKKGAIPLSKYLGDLFDEMTFRMENPTDIWGLRTGFSTFDWITGGLQLGETMLMSGVPGVGKSIMAMQMAVQLGKVSGGSIYSIEMGGLQVSRRIVSGASKIKTRLMKAGKVNDAEWQQILSTIQELEQLPVWMSDGTGWTTSSLRADLARLKARENIQWFVLDYMYLLNDGIGQNETERTALASKGLKSICKELNIAGIIIHSMNKSGMASDVPDQSMLRGSGQTIYDADVITFLTPYTPMSDKERFINQAERDNMRTLWFGKGRELENPQKCIQFVKHAGYPAFSEAKL